MAERVARREPNPHDLIVNIPPGTTKTTICSIMFPAWCWTRWWWMKFLSFGYSQDVSLQAADYSRKVIQSGLFRMVYPDLFLRQDKSGVSNYEIVKIENEKELVGGYRLSSSVGGIGTGLHADIQLVDDPIKPKGVHSVADLATVIEWFKDVLPTRKTDKDVSTMLLVMQRLGQDDPSGYLLESRPERVRHICLPASLDDGYDKFVQPKELMDRYVDGLLDPVRLSRKALQLALEDMGPITFAAQMGQNPVPPKGAMFEPDKMTVILTMPPDVSISRRVRYWDKAGTVVTKKGQNPAWTVGVLLLLLVNGKYLVADVKRGRWSAQVREDIIRATAEADGPDVEVVVEQEPGSGGKESAEGTIRRLVGFRVSADRPTGDKVLRADPLSVQVNAGNVMLLKGDWNREYIEEFRFFPNSTFKDQVDGTSGAFNRLARKREVWVGQRRGR